LGPTALDAPADDLAARTPTVYFVTDDSPQTGIEYTLNSTARMVLILCGSRDFVV
jgi:hypothetical protein